MVGNPVLFSRPAHLHINLWGPALKHRGTKETSEDAKGGAPKDVTYSRGFRAAGPECQIRVDQGPQEGGNGTVKTSEKGLPWLWVNCGGGLPQSHRNHHAEVTEKGSKFLKENKLVPRPKPTDCINEICDGPA